MAKKCEVLHCDLSPETCAICRHNAERINCEVPGKCRSINTDFCLKSCHHNKANDAGEREIGTTEDVIAVAQAFQNLDLVFLIAGYSPFGMY